MSWLYLCIGILTEILGTTALRAFVHDSPLLGQVIATISISLSYWFVAKAVLRIPLGVAYAVWCGVGLGGISILSWLLFQESMTLTKIAGILLVIVGMVMLNMDSGVEKSHG